MNELSTSQQLEELKRQAAGMQHPLPDRHRKENDQQYIWRAELTLQRAFQGLNDQYEALLRRYPNPGPATMAKLESLHARIMNAAPKNFEPSV